MTKTTETILFCLAFSSQILLLTAFHSRRLIRNRRYVLEHCPPSTHPRLYPQPLEYYERKLEHFARLSLAITAIGFLIVAAILGALAGWWDGGIFNPARESAWGSFIVVPYFIVQTFSALYLDFSLKHSFAMAKAPPPRIRTTELQRRVVNDFVSPAALAVAVILNIAYVVFLLYYRRFEFPWYSAAANIAGVLFFMLVLGGVLLLALRAQKADPYQSPADRREQARFWVQQALAGCIALPVLVGATLIFKSFDANVLTSFAASVFCQGFALAMLWPSMNYRVDRIDYDVYRQDAPAGSP